MERKPLVMDEDGIRDMVAVMMPVLDERQRRLFLGSVSIATGFGSASMLSEHTGVSVHTISTGRKDAESAFRDPKARPIADGTRRVRAEGGGRKSIVEKDPTLVTNLMGLINGSGSEGVLDWTVKGARTLSEELRAIGHGQTHNIILSILRTEGFSIQGDRKNVRTGGMAAERDRQLWIIDRDATEYARSGDPVIVVDVIGTHESPPLGSPEDHIPAEACVPHVTGPEHRPLCGESAIAALGLIRSWIEGVGRVICRDADRLLLVADYLDVNGACDTILMEGLQELADRTGLTIDLRHLLPATIRWRNVIQSVTCHTETIYCGCRDVLDISLKEVSTGRGVFWNGGVVQSVQDTGDGDRSEDIKRWNLIIFPEGHSNM